MAHFASLDQNNVVIDVLVVNNSDVDNLPFPDSEAVGIAYLNSFLPPATYAQTSYNGNFRAHFAGMGYTFYPEWGTNGGFCPAKPYPSWLLDTVNLIWNPPVPYPADMDVIAYQWDEATLSWVPGIKTIQPTIIG